MTLPEKLLAEMPGTTRYLADRVGCSVETARRNLSMLRSIGLVDTVSNGTRWQVWRRIAIVVPLDKVEGYPVYRAPGHLEERLLQELEAGPVEQPELVSATGGRRASVSRALHRLQARGLIELVGTALPQSTNGQGRPRNVWRKR